MTIIQDRKVSNKELIHKFHLTKSDYNEFLKKYVGSNLRTFDIAKQINVTEAELLSVRLNSNLKYLSIPDPSDFFHEIQKFKKIMLLTRNEYVVHEKIISPQKLEFTFEKNYFLKYENLPLIQFHDKLWTYAFSEYKNHNNRDLRSFQLFNNYGDSLLKIFLKSKESDHFNKIVKKYSVDYNYECQNLGFNDHMGKNNVGLSLASEFLELSFLKSDMRVEDEKAIRKILEFSSKHQINIGIYVLGNSSIQYHFEKINKVVDYADWLNVLDSHFNLHLKEEIFDNIVQIYFDNNKKNKCHLHFLNYDGDILLGMSFDGEDVNIILDLLKK